MAEDCVNHSCSLDELSAFPFENSFWIMKGLVRIANNPIAQAANGLSENPTHVKNKKFISKLVPKSRNGAGLLKTGERAFVVLKTK